MAARKRKRARRSTDEQYPGWVWMIFGLAIGLSVAFAIYMRDQRPPPNNRAVAQQPASMSAPMETATAPPPAPADSDEEPRFSFYDMLPNFEVVIPEQEQDVKRDKAIEIIEDPGIYVLQAGSFSAASDADRRRAELALLGIESRVQKVTIDDRTYHRVRIGPIENLDTLNLMRDQLRQADIDVLRIRLGE